MIIIKQSYKDLIKKVKELKEERGMIFKEMYKYRSGIRGSVISLYKMCGNKKCDCHTTKRKKHGLAYYISSSHKGKTNMLYIPSVMMEEAKRRIDSYKRLLNLLEELSEINREIFILEKRIKKGGKRNDGKAK